MTDREKKFSDIIGQDEVTNVVHTFYKRVQQDAMLGEVFDEIVKIDWPAHLPVMVSFWQTILFGDGGYAGNPLMAHMKWANEVSMSPEQFQHWLSLFHLTIDDLYRGPKADALKMKSSQMAKVLPQRIAEFKQFS